MNTESVPPPGGPFAPPITESDVRRWSMLCHLAALCGIPFPSLGAVVGPLVVWLFKRNDHPIIDANGKEALNFHLSVMLYSWILVGVGFLTMWILIGFVFFGLAFILGIAALVLSVVAAFRVSNGESYRYPITIRFFA